MISILHIGLPLAPPWLTVDESKKIGLRLADIRQRMEAAGYRYQVAHASPGEGLNAFRELLRTDRFDAVLIGGAVSGDPNLADFKKQIVAAVREEAPKAKLLEFDHTLDVKILVERAFGISQ